MATGVQVWSPTPATNATADSNINWAEGMAPSAVNDSARSMMASVAKWRDDNTGVSVVTSGSSGALTVVTNQVEAALTTGFTIKATLGTNISGAATLAADGLAATSIFTGLSTASLVTTGQFSANQIVSFVFSTGVGPGNGWIASAVAPHSLTNFTASLASSVNLSTAATYTDVVSVTQGTSGVWFVTSSAQYSSVVAGTTFVVRLWDGTTVINNAAVIIPSASNPNPTATLSGVIANPVGNLRLSGRVFTAGQSGGVLATDGSNDLKNTTITAVRIG